MEGLTGASRLCGSGAPDSFDGPLEGLAVRQGAAPTPFSLLGPPSPPPGLTLSAEGARMVYGFVTKASR
jgi:hypothetical protein